ncbi:MAG: hypothetical protein ACJA01_004308 [Saprospiraceae bacterium]|jgi:hypothetical protein
MTYDSLATFRSGLNDYHLDLFSTPQLKLPFYFVLSIKHMSYLVQQSVNIGVAKGGSTIAIYLPI